MTLYKNFLLKRGVGLFSRVGLVSGDYGRWNSDTIFPYKITLMEDVSIFS